MRYLFVLFTGIFIFLILFCIACSKQNNPIESQPNIPDNQPISSTLEGNRDIIAVYDMFVDPSAKTVKLTSSDRISNYHFPLTNIYPDTLKIIAQGWNPSFWVTLLLSHPMPGSGIDAYDPRIIVILPAYSGVDCFYPIFNVQANNSVIKDIDGYTKLYDNLGGAIAGNANPFRAYFKDQPYRVWSSTGSTSDAQRWYLDLNGFDEPLTFKLVVDISSNYPSPSKPVSDNASEPVEIDTLVGDGLTVEGGSAPIEVTFLDWQGDSSIKCKVEAPDLFDSAIQLLYSRPGSNPNEYVFSGTINNSKLAPAGYYDILIAAWDIPTDIHVFKEAIAHVESVPPHPIDVTPPWLQNQPREIVVNGNYAYTISSALQIYDVSNPLNPFWVGWVDLEDTVIDLDVSNGYAYVANYYNGLQIIDIDPPEDAHIEKTVDTPDRAVGVKVLNGYAYVADSHTGLVVIDIEPIQDSQIIKTIHDDMNLDWADQVYISNNYAYVINYLGLYIIDIVPLDTAYVVKMVPLPDDGYAGNIYVSGDYAYVAFGDTGLHIIDIEPPDSAYMVKTLTFTREADDIWVSNGIAYVACYDAVQIVDVDPPDTANLIKTVVIPGIPSGLFVSDEYLFAAAREGGLQIVDITPPEDAYIAKSLYMLSEPIDVDIDGDYAYVADDWGGFKILDIEPPSEAHIISTVYFKHARDVQVSGGLAYVNYWYGGLYIINVKQPDAPYIEKIVTLPNFTEDLFVTDEYAYMADWKVGIQVIDISPPDSASLVKTIEFPGGCFGVHVSDGYAYAAAGGEGMHVIDIDPLDDAHIVKTVYRYSWDSITGLYVNGEYAYAADGNDGLWIVDITPPESAYIVNVVQAPDDIDNVCVAGSYAYASGFASVFIIDIDPPITAHITETISSNSTAYHVSIADEYMYVANNWDGLRILKMW